MNSNRLFASLVSLVSLVGLGTFGCAVAPQVAQTERYEDGGEPDLPGTTDLWDTPFVRVPKEPTLPEEPGTPEACHGTTVVGLIAGQTIDAGTVTVRNDNVNVCVSYKTSGGWYLSQTHIDVELATSDVPQTASGNPVPGAFEDAQDHDPLVQVYTKCFLLEDLGIEAGAEIVVAAHAAMVRLSEGEVVQEETGWGDGEPFPGSNWAEYIMHTIPACGRP